MNISEENKNLAEIIFVKKDLLKEGEEFRINEILLKKEDQSLEDQRYLLDIRNRIYYPKKEEKEKGLSLQKEIEMVLDFIRGRYRLNKEKFSEPDLFFLKSFKNMDPEKLGELSEKTIRKLYEIRARVM